MENPIKKDYVAMVLNIVDTVVIFASWGIVLAGAAYSPNASSVTSYILKAFQLVVLGFNIDTLIKYRRQSSTIAGPILGIIGTALTIISWLFALPSFVLMILAAIFVGITKYKPRNVSPNYNVDPNDPNGGNQVNDPNTFNPNQNPNDPHQTFNDQNNQF